MQSHITLNRETVIREAINLQSVTSWFYSESTLIGWYNFVWMLMSAQDMFCFY